MPTRTAAHWRCWTSSATTSRRVPLRRAPCRSVRRARVGQPPPAQSPSSPVFAYRRAVATRARSNARPQSVVYAIDERAGPKKAGKKDREKPLFVGRTPPLTQARRSIYVCNRPKADVAKGRHMGTRAELINWRVSREIKKSSMPQTFELTINLQTHPRSRTPQNFGDSREAG